MRQAGGLDSTFLALETHDHPLHVMAVMALDPTTVPDGYSFEGLRGFVADRLGGIPPFRQKLVPVPLGVGRPRWVDVDVDVNEHVHRAIFDGGGFSELARFVADWEPVPLDREVPLWSMYVVEGLDDGIVAVVAKVHHALMDGVGGMQFMASMFSLTPTPEPVVLAGDAEERTPPPWERVLRAVPEVASRAGSRLTCVGVVDARRAARPRRRAARTRRSRSPPRHPTCAGTIRLVPRERSPSRRCLSMMSRSSVGQAARPSTMWCSQCSPGPAGRISKPEASYPIVRSSPQSQYLYANRTRT